MFVHKQGPKHERNLKAVYRFLTSCNNIFSPRAHVSSERNVYVNLDGRFAVLGFPLVVHAPLSPSPAAPPLRRTCCSSLLIAPSAFSRHQRMLLLPSGIPAPQYSSSRRPQPPSHLAGRESDSQPYIQHSTDAMVRLWHCPRPRVLREYSCTGSHTLCCTSVCRVSTAP
ncbi:hypothetical protein L226DRAFT_341640 [Lentinus tigrinus ALCF2SS1-7]|uniref:uncharacterized protein n=1 Tax=Lentinus tigrinus ALCF2SS1-7 TaxID=1328758 RepID=UPI0011661E92|nr:hypothetical protein L226DRAFT_341640 [Lentinus tigrinus ALCF2SS1-7]